MVSEKQASRLHTHRQNVLILVLVEDGLGVFKTMPTRKKRTSLNPCFSGGWSRSEDKENRVYNLQSVLILVLVEDGLGG